MDYRRKAFLIIIGTMEKIGIIGGVGPEATVQYYLQMVSRYRTLFNTAQYPEIVINSIDMKKMVDLVAAVDFEGLTTFLSNEIEILAKCGVKIAAVTSNTPHMVFDQLQARTNIKLISIVEAACAAVKSAQVSRVGLIGTKLTMTGKFYDKVAAKYGIGIFVPDEGDQTFIHTIYLGELVHNIIKPDTKARLISIVESMRAKYQLEGVILGGTELPLIIDEPDFPGFNVFNTTRIQIDAIFEAVRA